MKVIFDETNSAVCVYEKMCIDCVLEKLKVDVQQNYWMFSAHRSAHALNCVQSFLH